MSTSTSIVVFDGVCTLCNTTVDFLIRHDHQRTLRYGSFQSDHIASLLRSHNITETPTTVYVITPDNTVLTQSTAIIYLGHQLGGIWKLMSVVVKIIPRPLRDVVYQWISDNRYRWFGKKDSCRLPSPEERSLFL